MYAPRRLSRCFLIRQVPAQATCGSRCAYCGKAYIHELCDSWVMIEKAQFKYKQRRCLFLLEFSAFHPTTNMPLKLHQMTEADTLSWTRVRAIAYYGPTHDLLHAGPISESSMRGVAEDRKREINQPNTWHWKIVDTDVEPHADDPPDNGGRTIAISVWSMHNLATEAGQNGSNEVSSVPVEKTDKVPGFLPPELRLDALGSLLGPLRAAQESIMGTTKRYFKLNQLATHPDYQGRGAARMMLDWGMERADREGLAVYLDATEKGMPVYERRGFKLVKGIEWDRVPWGGEGRDWHGCMVREAGNKA